MLCKVLFFHPARQAYGSEKSLIRLLASLDGFATEIVCQPDSAIQAFGKDNQLRVYPIEFGKFSLMQNPLWHLTFFWEVLSIIRRAVPDVVVINLDGNTPLIVLAARCLQVPLVRFCRFEFSPPKLWRDKQAWLAASAVICPSEWVRSQIQEWAPRGFYSKVHALYNPQEIPDHSVRTNLQGFLGEYSESLQVIGYFGRLHPEKKIHNLVEAMAIVGEMFVDTHLIIVGDHDGSDAEVKYKRSLIELVRENNLDGRVHFLGYQSDAMSLIAQCSVCAMPSTSESFGRVLVEAWSYRVPTVASDVSGLRELTQASGGGLLFPVGNIMELSKRLTELLRSNEYARQLGERGQNWVEKNCDPKVYALKFQKIVEGVAEGDGCR